MDRLADCRPNGWRMSDVTPDETAERAARPQARNPCAMCNDDGDPCSWCDAPRPPWDAERAALLAKSQRYEE
jgi:hypothetical protein